MKVWELIEKLKTMDQRLPVVAMADEFCTLHDISEPKVVKMVKGDMFMSNDGEDWVQDDGHLYGPNKQVHVAETMQAVRIY